MQHTAFCGWMFFAQPHLFAQMELFFVNDVALFYVLWLYFACKRRYCTLCARGGRRSLKRLQRCAPQVLVRSARTERQCQLLLDQFVQRRHWLQYGFCYYYGGHANSLSAWLMSAGTLYALWNDLHASSIGECYAWSVITFSGMTAPWCYGRWLGVALGVAMPAFMRCQVCPPERTAEGCMEFHDGRGQHHECRSVRHHRGQCQTQHQSHRNLENETLCER